MDSVQGDLTHAMRSILIDWMVEVAEEYTLAPQALFLAVAYLDRFLSKQVIDRSRLQLVGVTALLLAAKYWEIYPPAIDEFVHISDHTYTKLEVLAMENALLTAPTSWEFSRKFCKAAGAHKQTEKLVDVRTTDTRARQHRLNRQACNVSSPFFLCFFVFVVFCLPVGHVRYLVVWSGERQSLRPAVLRRRQT